MWLVCVGFLRLIVVAVIVVVTISVFSVITSVFSVVVVSRVVGALSRVGDRFVFSYRENR